jgi:hypothetical protein
MKFKNYLLILCSFISLALNAQQLSQTIRGRVLDKDTQSPLPGATVSITIDNVLMGTATDEDGYYKLENIPVGRHQIAIQFVGYDPYLVNELLVSSSKETILDVALTENVTQLGEVVVSPTLNKDEPINQMAAVSSRMFSVEEAQRFAGGFDDPTRLASVYAGVSAPEVESNGISVRGNAPSMVQYRMEGMEIESANHFEGGDLLGGGFVSIFNSHLLANSDFLTGAFPALYGNALSAVFDMNMRTGNNQQYEHAAQVGIMGIDLASEGPFKQGKRSSYLFNYRYSTFGLLQGLLPEGEGLPVYQDLAFKLNFPTKKGVFSVWGAGAIDNFFLKAKTDPSEWDMELKRREINADFMPAMVGVNYKHLLSKKSYLFTSFLYNYNYKKEDQKWIGPDLNLYESVKMENTKNVLAFSSFINKKFSARHTNTTGLIVRNLAFKFNHWVAPENYEPLQNINNSSGNTTLLQGYSQSRISLSGKLTANLGLHFQTLTLNNKSSVEPRLSLKYQASNKFSMAAAYGAHSRMQILNHYFLKGKTVGEENITPNKNLDFTRAHHFVLGINYKLGEYARLKIEPYYQMLTDIPVVEDSSFAVINLQYAEDFNEVMVNEGTGTNIGIEFTLERFLHRGYYYLLSASVYDAKYKGGDGVERNNAYNGNYVANLLFGKEWRLGADKNKAFSANGRLYMTGGNRQSPVNQAESIIRQEVVYDNEKLYEDQSSALSRFDLSLSYSRNRPKYTSTISIQVLNLLGSVISYRQVFDYVQNKVVVMEGTSTLPNISWKIQF